MVQELQHIILWKPSLVYQKAAIVCSAEEEFFECSRIAHCRYTVQSVTGNSACTILFEFILTEPIRRYLSQSHGCISVVRVASYRLNRITAMSYPTALEKLFYR